MLSFEKFREANVERCNKSFHLLNEWSACDWMTALAGEVGETANLIKKRRRGEKICKQDIADELADVVAYVDLLAASLDIDLSDAVIKKFNEVSDRVKSEIKL